MARLTSELHGRVQTAQQFDQGALLNYARSNVDGFPLSPVKFTVSQFGHGQSNPTFLLEALAEGQSGPSTKRYVLRKKPPGQLLQSAHAVEREFQIWHFDEEVGTLKSEEGGKGGDWLLAEHTGRVNQSPYNTKRDFSEPV